MRLSTSQNYEDLLRLAQIIGPAKPFTVTPEQIQQSGLLEVKARIIPLLLLLLSTSSLTSVARKVASFIIVAIIIITTTTTTTAATKRLGIE